MNLGLRVLGVAVFIAAFAGASYGAFQVFDTDPAFTKVTLTAQGGGDVQLPAGGEGPVALTVENQGESPVNLSIVSTDDRFSFTTARHVLTVAPGATQTARGSLAALADVGERTTVELAALENRTGRQLAKVQLTVQLLEELTVEPVLPGVLPGTNATARVTVVNVLDQAQRFNFSVQDGAGTITPATTNVQPGSPFTAIATIPASAEATGALEATVEVTNATGRLLTGTFSVPVVAPGEAALAASIDRFMASPGNDFTAPIVVVSNLEAPVEAEVEADGLREANIGTIQPGSAVGGYVTMLAPTEASDGPITRTITVTLGEVSYDVDVTVDTSPAGSTAAVGDRVSVDYVGRLPSGEVFDTSVAVVGEGPFPRTDDFRPRQQYAPLEIGLQQGGAIEGFTRGVAGLHEGESRTVVLPPSLAYGPATEHENVSATTPLQRTQVLAREIDGVSKAQLPPEFDIENKTEGDTITFGDSQTGGPFKLLLTNVTERTVDILRVDEIGDDLTFFPPWPNATEVTERNETHITYTTTPPADLGTFTWDANPQSHQAGWGQTTTVESVDAETILLRHAPEPGTNYTASPNPQMPPTEYTVHGVNEGEVHVSFPNRHPLAGKTLIFDITLREVLGSAQGGGLQVGG